MTKNFSATQETKKVLNNEINCAICGVKDNYKVIYPEKIKNEKLDFSSRQEPKRIHARFVKCKGCNLIYSNPILPEKEVIQSYIESKHVDELQLDSYLEDYAKEFKRIMPFIKDKGSLLEIGCGNGFFLKVAIKAGFRKIVGIEPGIDAVNKSSVEVKDKIISGVFSDKLFESETFDIVCFFQVFDHIVNPNEFLKQVYHVLKPGGIVLAISHDVRSFFNMVLGENSPVYSIGHIYLFDKDNLAKIFRKNNFNNLYVKNMLNSYVLEYVIKMFPMPQIFKKFLIKTAKRLKISNLKLKFPAGNLVLAARKI